MKPILHHRSDSGKKSRGPLSGRSLLRRTLRTFLPGGGNRRRRFFSGFRIRLTGSVLLASMLNLVLVVQGSRLSASPDYGGYSGDSSRRVQGYVDRAYRMEDESSWEAHVRLGLAREYAEWEADAYDTSGSAGCDR